MPEEDQALLREAIAAAGDIQGLLTAMMSYWEAGPTQDGSGGAVMRLPLLLRGVVFERKAAVQEAGGQIEVANDLDCEVPASVQAVLKELITNCCKFRRMETPLRIRIETHLRDGFVEIAVTDNGVGVPSEYVDKIFSPFQRLYGREFPGHGLGLATCRRLALAWGGSMKAESDSTGRFTVRVTAPVRGS